jgi:hypothetical protein
VVQRWSSTGGSTGSTARGGAGLGDRQDQHWDRCSGTLGQNRTSAGRRTGSLPAWAGGANSVPALGDRLGPAGDRLGPRWVKSWDFRWGEALGTARRHLVPALSGSGELLGLRTRSALGKHGTELGVRSHSGKSWALHWKLSPSCRRGHDWSSGELLGDSATQTVLLSDLPRRRARPH